MSQVHNTYTQFVDAAAGDAQLHTAPGYILAIIITSNVAAQTVTFTDSSGAGGNTLLKLDIRNTTTTPIFLNFDNRTKIRFEEGLKVNPGDARVFIITEV